MSQKTIKKSTKDQKEGTYISLNESCELLDKYCYSTKENLDFEIKLFLISSMVLLSSNIYINKANVNNYNFKIIFLILLYFSRRIILHFWYNYRLKEKLVYTTNKVLFAVILLQMLLNIAYIFWDLIINYSIYNMLPLFYILLLQIPMFVLDSSKRYENAPKEMNRFLKKSVYLSLEVCYYGICIPIFFSMRNSPYLNLYAILIYSLFTCGNLMALLFSYGFYKKSAEFHFHAKVYGYWKRIRKDEIPIERLLKMKSWVYQPYEKDQIVEHRGKYYIAVEDKNLSEPNDVYANWLYFLFNDPKKTYEKVFTFQGYLTIGQLVFDSLTNFNFFSLNLSIMSWYIFYMIYKNYKKIKTIFNK